MATKTRAAADIIEELFKSIDDRQRKVLTKRFGLDTGKEMTLAGLGKVFGVTRERIRQIEASALSAVRDAAKKGHVDVLIKDATARLKKSGGIRKENHLLQDLSYFAADAKNIPVHFANQIRFLLGISGEVWYYREDETLASHWHLSKEHQKKAKTFLEALIKHIKDKKYDVLHKDQFDAFFKEVTTLHKLEKEVAKHYLNISKKFGKNIYGDFGLMDWAEVNPRVSRDWIYLILKKAGKPMHFEDIAKEIRTIRPGAKRTNTQTIHNELIKDKRFILVGRGIYGLREMDALPAGTIREILIHILKENGPMKPKEIISSVLKNRIFKETTILFNLQNKRYFKRLSNGTYSAA